MKKETIPCKEIDVRLFAYAISLVDGKWKMENAHFILAMEKRDSSLQ